MSGPQTLPFDSESAYRDALDAVLMVAARRIDVFDRDLARMQLDDPRRCGLLRRFLQANREHRLRIVVHDVRPLQDRSPRLAELCRNYGHAVEVRETPDALRHLADTHVVAANGHAVVRFHADFARGKLVVGDLAGTHPLLERFEQLWGDSRPASVGTPLGL